MIDWISAGLALIRLTSTIAAWMERQTAEKDGFRQAVALEMAATAKALARGTKIDGKIDKMSHEELVAAAAKWDRSQRVPNNGKHA